MKHIFTKLQDAVKRSGAEAWVLYDFRKNNNLAWEILQLEPNAHCTRRWVVVIPAIGFPTKIVHQMEQAPLEHLPIHTVLYAGKDQWENALRETLAPYSVVAMEYSENNALPVVSKVDAGTIEHIRSLGTSVMSSADILQEFTAVLNEDQIATNAVTAGQLRNTVMNAFEMIANAVEAKETITEYDVQQYILSEFHRQELVTDSGPIVAIGQNASRPHYVPTFTETSTIGPDTVVLIDAWCKHRHPGSVYADITWVGYTGTDVPTDIAASFGVIVNARNAALNLVKERFAAKVPVYGYELDNACRNVVKGAGLESRFIHRTGHNITHEVHGPGANLDDYETHDTRRIIPGTSFSIEPGIYVENLLGLRTEIDVVITHSSEVLVPTEPIQQEILALGTNHWRT